MPSILGFIVKHSTYISEYVASNTQRKNNISATKGCTDFVANQSSTQANNKKTSALFWYQGVAKCLKNTFRNVMFEANSELPLTFFIDGVPLHKSSRMALWPILMRIHTMPHVHPMTVAIFCGPSKPSSTQEYLGELVDELNLLMEQSINLGRNGTLVKIRIRLLEHSLKASVQGFGGKHGCMKCTVVGYRHSISNAMCFPIATMFPARTNEAFRGMEYGEHHKETTPLIKLDNFDIVEDVIVSDRLHLIDLGVTRKFLQGWIFGQWGAPQLSPEAISNMSIALTNISLPSEIHRKFRQLDDVRFWKGSEYSSFLHYA
uniref:Uncharacterized protein n=1 Tax=Anopheles arabiensis TaxID=7173 RepID=A0A182ICM1_ANOAR